MTLSVVSGGKGSGGAEPPNNGAVTVERYERAAAALKSHKSTTGATWDDIATELGGQWSKSTINSYAGGKYPLENARNITEAIEQFMSTLDERRSLVTQTAFVETSIALKVLSLLKKATLLTKIAVIAAESGTGKTKTLQWYWTQHPRTVYLKANATFISRHHASVWPLVRKLMLALGTAAANGNTQRQAESYDVIVNALRGTGRPVIIDEAQFLTPEALDLVRCIHEEADVPFILGGNETLYERAVGSSRGAAAFTQFQSRSFRAHLTTAEIKPSDVTLIAEQLIGVDVARDAAPILLDQARSAGGFRRLVSVLQLAQTLREGSGAVRKEHVLAAIKELLGGER